MTFNQNEMALKMLAVWMVGSQDDGRKRTPRRHQYQITHSLRISHTKFNSIYSFKTNDSPRHPIQVITTNKISPFHVYAFFIALYVRLAITK